MKMPSKEAIKAADAIIDAAEFEGASIDPIKLARCIDEAFSERHNKFKELLKAAQFMQSAKPTTPRFDKAIAECLFYQ